MLFSFSNIVDGIILLVSLNNVTKRLPLKLKEKLDAYKLPILGGVTVKNELKKLFNDEDIEKYPFLNLINWVDE